jgi:hypothetical protein
LPSLLSSLPTLTKPMMYSSLLTISKILNATFLD